MNIQRSSKMDEWGTPAWLVDKCRTVLGTIDIDPCSNKEWNTVIKATTFLTKEDNSLYNNWCTIPQSIFINPPGGKLKNKSLTSLYWQCLCDHYRKGLVKHAIWIGFSLEQLAISQSYGSMFMIDFPMCIPRSRIEFDQYPGYSGKAPSHSNFILYIPGSINNTEFFQKEFKCLGVINIK